MGNDQENPNNNQKGLITTKIDLELSITTKSNQEQPKITKNY